MKKALKISHDITNQLKGGKTMHKKEFLLLTLITVIFLFLCPSFAQQTLQKSPAPAPLPQQQTIQQPAMQSVQKITNFSADLITINPQGVVTQRAKIYITPSKMRIDTVLPPSGSNVAMIFRRDLNVRWMLNPANKTYIKQPLNEAEINAFVQGNIAGRSEKILGTQTVSGFTCTIKTVEATATIRGVSRKIISTIWVSSNLDFPIRTKSQDGSITELRNFTTTLPPEGLFELPGDYRQVSNTKALGGTK
jgi:hypothetical protein